MPDAPRTLLVFLLPFLLWAFVHACHRDKRSGGAMLLRIPVPTDERLDPCLRIPVDAGKADESRPCTLMC